MKLRRGGRKTFETPGVLRLGEEREKRFGAHGRQEAGKRLRFQTGVYNRDSRSALLSRAMLAFEEIRIQDESSRLCCVLQRRPRGH